MSHTLSIFLLIVGPFLISCGTFLFFENQITSGVDFALWFVVNILLAAVYGAVVGSLEARYIERMKR